MDFQEQLDEITRQLGLMRVEIDALKVPAKGAWKKCDHAMQAVQLGEITLYATRQSSITQKTPLPDVGVYLDTSWLRIVMDGAKMLGVGVVGIGQKPKYPFVMVDWPDRGVIPIAHLTDLVTWIRKEAKAKRVEISCIGGHGRTGTLLAALAIRELHLTADAAIKHVRDNYCSEAVESHEQENLLRRFNGEAEVKKAATNYVAQGGHGYACKCVVCESAKTHEDNCNCNACQTLLGGYFGAF